MRFVCVCVCCCNGCGVYPATVLDCIGSYRSRGQVTLMSVTSLTLLPEGPGAFASTLSLFAAPSPISLAPPSLPDSTSCTATTFLVNYLIFLCMALALLATGL